MKGGSKGKGKSSGPKGGCYICGGQHYQADCPMRAKGKGKGAVYHIEQWSTPGETRPLCTIQSVPPVKVHNRFSVLAEAAGPTTTLGYFVVKRVKQCELKRVSSRISSCPTREGAQKAQLNGTSMGFLSPLQTIEPEGANSVATADWEPIEFAVDSGASETVMGEDMAKYVPTKPSDASRRGVMYEVGNGERIPNLGEKVIRGVTDGEGYVRSITAQICDVNKPLLSVHKLVQAGNTVVFGPGGSYIQDQTTGEQIWLREAGGMYMAKMWVPTSAKAGF